MSKFQKVLPHGTITEVFPDVFFVTGSMSSEFFGSTWQFSRNMIIVREGSQLSLINTVRLDDEGLAALDELGDVTNVIRIGDMHGVDDPFYIQRYKATFWAMQGMGIQDELTVDKELTADGEMPFNHCSLFEFSSTKRPEGILHLDREGGIMISCDALQNWAEPDEFIIEETENSMREMGFFTPANLGPAWMHESEPQAEDFIRLKEIPFKHALCAHGTPLRDVAQKNYHATFERIFGV